MISTLRNTMRRTLVLTGLAVAAVTLASAAGLMVQGAQVNGSTLVVAVVNASSQPVSGTVQAVVLVNGISETLSMPFVLTSGQSALLPLRATGQISGTTSVGIIQDSPVPY